VIFGGSFGTFEENLAQGKPFSKCGKCNRLMKLADKLNKLHCDVCKVTLDLPAGGSFKLAGDRKCPLDNFGLLLYVAVGVQNQRYFVCPHCYNNSPFPEVSSNLSCNLCIQEDCPYSVPNNELKDCDTCKEGALVIDQQAGAKVTATCNACTCEVLISDNAVSVVRDKKECGTCGSYLFKAITLKGQTQGFSQQKYENICIFCHKEFKEISKPKVIANPNPRRGGFRGRRGRGGRRGRRGGRRPPERDWRDI